MGAVVSKLTQHTADYKGEGDAQSARAIEKDKC